MNIKNAILELPGLVDVHVHLREPGAIQKEDFETGTRAAIAGGFTQILDMPNNNPPTVTLISLSQKEQLARGRIWCDVGFNFGATVESIADFKKVIKKVFGLKVYMNHTTGPLLVENRAEQDSIFKNWASKQPIMVHAEGEMVEVALSLAKKYKKLLHVCHVSFDQIRSIEKAKKDGVIVSCEVCPHHLFLNHEDVKMLGPLGIMKPPLFSKKDQKNLWLNLDKVDMIATDHAPHTLDEKYDQSQPKFGVPGLETVLPLMLEAVSKRLITLKRLIEMMSDNPRRIFNLPLQPGTYVVVDFSKKYQIGHKKLFTKTAWTPFARLVGRGEIKKVVVRGLTIFSNGRFLGKPHGQIIYPDL